ncbi:MAG: hypothetical protein PWP59_71 [Sphaerochaeta sp.]|jgi:hypothetical protein|nr:hypothetical protein [Sphaerochaeta sp.]
MHVQLGHQFNQDTVLPPVSVSSPRHHACYIPHGAHVVLQMLDFFYPLVPL